MNVYVSYKKVIVNPRLAVALGRKNMQNINKSNYYSISFNLLVITLFLFIPVVIITALFVTFFAINDTLYFYTLSFFFTSADILGYIFLLMYLIRENNFKQKSSFQRKNLMKAITVVLIITITIFYIAQFRQNLSFFFSGIAFGKMVNFWAGVIMFVSFCIWFYLSIIRKQDFESYSIEAESTGSNSTLRKISLAFMLGGYYSIILVGFFYDVFLSVLLPRDERIISDHIVVYLLIAIVAIGALMVPFWTINNDQKGKVVV